MPSRLDERAWIARCKLFGDEKAFSKLVDAYKGKVLRFFLIQTGGDQELSDDLAQETFIKVWNKLQSLDQAKYFSTWLYRLAYNIWIDHLRRRRISEQIEGKSIPDEGGAGDKLDRMDLQSTLLDALSHLNEQERVSVTLFYLNEMSIKEIVKITGYAEGSVKGYLSRGREKLRHMPGLMELRNG